jgi:hypothetical protein
MRHCDYLAIICSVSFAITNTCRSCKFSSSDLGPKLKSRLLVLSRCIGQRSNLGRIAGRPTKATNTVRTHYGTRLASLFLANDEYFYPEGLSAFAIADLVEIYLTLTLVNERRFYLLVSLAKTHFVCSLCLL